MTDKEYWKANIKLLIVLLTIWLVIWFGFGIILSDFLDQFSIGGFKLGFWFAQQGSIYGFVILIFVYVLGEVQLFGKLQKEFVSLDDIVLNAQKNAIKSAVVGSNACAVHDVALRILVEGLKEIGLLKGTTEEIIE